MSLLNAGFEGLTEEDFDQYLPKCWSNNRYNLGRMRVKERLGLLIESVRAAIGAEGLTVESSSEIPSVWNGRQVRDQWAYVIRDSAEKRRLQPVMAKQLDMASRLKAPAEHLQHALIAVRLDHEVLEIALRINAHAVVDIINLLARAAADVAPLDAALANLDEEILLDDAPVTVPQLLAAADAARQGEREWIVVGRRIPREDAIAAGMDVVDLAGAVGTRLAPLFSYLRWREDNDHVGVETQLSTLKAEREETIRVAQEARAEKKKAHAERAEQARARTMTRVEAESMWRKLQAKTRTSSAPPAAKPLDADAAPAPSKGRPPRRPTAPAGTRGDRRDGRATASKQRAADKSKKQAKGAPRPDRRKGPAETFAVGERCLLTRGLFAGKEGEVRAADKPGYYKVKVGTLEVAVSAHELQKLD